MKNILISFLVVVVAVGAAWHFLKPRSAAPIPEETKPVAQVETVTLAEGSIAQTIEVFGLVSTAPSGDHVIPAPYDIVIRKVHVSTGTPVAAGDILLEVDAAPDMRLAATAAHNAHALAEKSLAGTRERYELRLATRQELETAELAVEDTRLKDDSFLSRGIGGDGRIIAANAGVVGKVDLTSGTPVTMGTALLTVSNGTELEARLGVEATDLSRLSRGQSVALESANRPGHEKFAGMIRSVGASLDAATGTAEVRASLPPGGGLLLGEHLRAEIELAKKEHVLVVPRSAVLTSEDKLVLYTVKKGKAVRHEVQLGLASDDAVELTGGGLIAGDVVVTLGNYELEDGMEVQVAEEKEKISEQPATKTTEETKP